MRVLAVEPYYGGSHREFLDGWRNYSRHDWSLLTLPARHWKWRMRHAAWTLSEQLVKRVPFGSGEPVDYGRHDWNLIVCSDMLNVAEFRGLAPRHVSRLPIVAYFHENQFTYPSREARERDHHFAFTNLISALAADEVWFNSAFNQSEMLNAAEEFLRRMPDYQLVDSLAAIRDKSRIAWPGIAPPEARPPRRSGPLVITWAARWEHDKNPECFFEALRILAARGREFRIRVLGQSYREQPAVFEAARKELGEYIESWGYLAGKDDYHNSLATSDVFVSTALHEFFGLAVLEAIAAGNFPLLPRRLSYPELLELDANPDFERYFYNGSAESLADRLDELVVQASHAPRVVAPCSALRTLVQRYHWPQRVAEMDDALESLASKFGQLETGDHKPT